MDESGSDQQVGYILRSYPRLSQTFILNEILGLEQLGVNLSIFAIANSGERLVQPQARQVRAPVYYLQTFGRRRRMRIFIEQILAMIRYPAGYFRTAWFVLRHPELDEGYTVHSRWESFLLSVHLAHLIRHEERRSGKRLSHLHAHFAHNPAEIADLTHRLTGIPYSFTAHARDVYQVPKPVLAQRMETAKAVVTCCGSNLGYLRGVASDRTRSQTRLIPHGVNVEAFRPPSGSKPAQTETPLIVSAGRLIEKKGFPDLLCALQQLHSAGYSFQCEIYGDGPLYDELKEHIAALGLEGAVSLKGAYTQPQIIPALQHATVFALTPAVTEDGDRDGIPNVLAEAMACGVPVVSTAVSGIPELVVDGVNGRLAAPHDVQGIRDGLAALLDDPDARRMLGAQARLTMVERFDQRAGVQQLAELFHMGKEAGHAA